MSDALYDLLKQSIPPFNKTNTQSNTSDASKYLARLLSLRLSDLNTTEPQSIQQASQSVLVSLQALSSRSYRTTTISSDHLTNLTNSLPALFSSTAQIRDAVPRLDESAVKFASLYSRSKEDNNAALTARKESMLLARQADKLQDILELPSLLSIAITSAGTGLPGGANYSQALDLFAHIKRLQILYPDSALVTKVLRDAELAMKDMTTNLITSLRGQNIRLASAIRTIGWLRRVVPELSLSSTSSLSGTTKPLTTTTTASFSATSAVPAQPEEGSFGALFLLARLCTFLTMTEALAPLRDLADQETARRLDSSQSQSTLNSARPEPTRRTSTTPHMTQGQQTERYLKRYIEIFREQSFSCISMFRSIFPPDSDHEQSASKTISDFTSTNAETEESIESLFTLPSALATFPLHLVEIFMETLQTYLPNVTDSAARESLLMQVLYAANSLGRLGADFSLMIAMLDDPSAPVMINNNNDNNSGSKASNIDLVTDDAKKDAKMDTVTEEIDNRNGTSTDGDDKDATGSATAVVKDETTTTTESLSTAENSVITRTVPESISNYEPEWARVIKKHRVQAARLEAMAAGQEQVATARKGSAVDIAVR